MGFIGGLFSGRQGVSWEPERAASSEQAQQLYQQQQEQLRQQAAFAQMLQAQGPEAIAQQQMLGRQLAAQAQGAGPSVARTQLAQTTGENIAAQQALMAGQRGASANVGQMARQAGLLGARTQQQAAGQAATLRAQEQLASQAALAGITGQQLGQITGAQQLGMQGATAAQQNILNAIAQANAAKAGVAGQTAAGQGRIVGGIFEGLAGLGSRAAGGGAEGGEVGKDFANYADGGGIGSDEYWSRLQQDLGTMMPAMPSEAPELQGAGRAMGSALRGLMAPSKPQRGPMGSEMEDYTSLAHGGKVPAMVSPGEKYLPPSEVKKVAEGKKPAHKAGETIPGKAKVAGDSYENDTVKRNLEKGGIVIPRSVMQSEDAAEKARQFVAAVLARKQQKRK